MSVRTAWSVWFLAGAALLMPRVSRGQAPEEIAARRVLVQQAQDASNAGDHARALELSLRAARIQSTPSLRLLIAEEADALGRLGTAFGSADQCARDAERDAATPNRTEIIRRCRSMLTRLESRIAYVTIRVPSPTPSGLEVRIGDDVMPANLYGLPYVVTPGTVVIEAHAPGFAPVRREVTVVPRQSEDVALELTPTAATGGEPSGSSGTGSAGTTGPSQSTGEITTGPTAGPGPSGPPIDRGTPRRGGIQPVALALAVTGLGVGVAGFVLSGVFFGLRQSAVTGCVVTSEMVACPDDRTFNAAQSAPTYNTMINVGFVIGGVGLAAGVTALIVGIATAPRERPSRQAAVFEVSPTGSGAMLSVRGSL